MFRFEILFVILCSMLVAQSVLADSDRLPNAVCTAGFEDGASLTMERVYPNPLPNPYPGDELEMKTTWQGVTSHVWIHKTTLDYEPSCRAEVTDTNRGVHLEMGGTFDLQNSLVGGTACYFGMERPWHYPDAVKWIQIQCRNPDAKIVKGDKIPIPKFECITKFEDGSSEVMKVIPSSEPDYEIEVQAKKNAVMTTARVYIRGEGLAPGCRIEAQDSNKNINVDTNTIFDPNNSMTKGSACYLSFENTPPSDGKKAEVICINKEK